MNNALEIRGLTKRFPEFTLDHLDLTLPSGCVMGLVGENGAGKSTTIKLLLGMLRPDGGSVSILGKEGQPDALTKEDVGVVLDEVGLPDCLNAAKVGKVMSNLYRRWEPDTFERLVSEMDIPRNTVFGKRSRGNKM